MTRFAALAGLLLLTACGSSPERLAAADQDRCAGLGFRQGSEGLAMCRMQLQMQRSDHAEARRRDILNSIPDQPLQAPTYTGKIW